MVREEMAAEIALRTDIPLEDVEEVLDEEDLIFLEEERGRKTRTALLIVGGVVLVAVIAIAVIYYLDKKEKINVKQTVQNCTDKINEKCSWVSCMDKMSKCMDTFKLSVIDKIMNCCDCK